MSELYTLIESSDDLHSLAADLQSESMFALDTEFVWERTYYARLGLVQVGFENGRVALIDTVAVPDLSPLAPLLINENITKILHDAPQDLMIMRRATGSTSVNVFDTRLASGFIGLTSSLSLQNLHIELLDIHLEKHSTRTDWTRRPLSTNQLSYAVDDVLHLPTLMKLIREKATELNLSNWLDQEMQSLDRSPRFEDPVPEEQYLRMKESAFASDSKRAILYHLASWREYRARELDLPRKRVADDPELSSVATTQPRSENDLKSCEKLTPATKRRYSKQLLQCVEKGLAMKEHEIPPAPFSPKLRSINRDEAKDLLTRIHTAAETQGVDPQLVATNKDAAFYVHQRNEGNIEDNPLTTGWRGQLLADTLPA